MTPLFSRDLSALARLYGTDKWSDTHAYTPLYQQRLRQRRREDLTLLEIGIGGWTSTDGGASLRMWSRYLPRARIHGVDIREKRLEIPRVTTWQGDQGDRTFLLGLLARIGPPDIVVDDGSHLGTDVAAAFSVLFPAMAVGGLYVIEDTHTSYLPDFAGGPPGHAGSSMDLVKRLLDAVNEPDVAGAGHAMPPDLPQDVAAVHVHRQIVFIEKAGGGGTGRRWARRRPGARR